jgi:hypothetical protein
MQPPDNKKYHLRLLERFFHYDTITSHSFEYPAGAVVTDPTEIRLLEDKHGPTERIYIQTEFLR